MTLEGWQREQGLTTAELARRLCVSRATLYAWKALRQMPTAPHIYNIEKLTRNRVRAKDFVPSPEVANG